jgi:adenylate cyclase
MIVLCTNCIAQEQTDASAERSRNLGINFGLGGLAAGLIGVSLGYYMTYKKARRLNEELILEKKKSDNLLLNILPADIADELKEKGSASAKSIENVTVLFTDFKDFTSVAEKLSAAELIDELNYCFKGFDLITEKYNIEKIKVIGDAYMAAGGLSSAQTQSTANAVKAAMEMQQFIKERKLSRDKENMPAFEMRAGLHTGPVVAGVVGFKKFQYDIWGDTVNTASRMESSGEIGKVNISKSTYALIYNNQEFHFEHRGEVAAKNKGDVEMYFVSSSV